LDNPHNSVEQLRLASATEQARAIALGQISADELAVAETAARDAVNPRINAIVQLPSIEDSSVNQISQTNLSALAGTSFLVKDNIDVTGFHTHCGLKIFSTSPAVEDAYIVSRLKKAGLRFAGKSNMSPMALGSSSHNEDFSHCYNPLEYGFTAGGSSGGSASAVAAGLTGIALGTDTLGSVRIPAAFCGIVGFKPSWGQIPVNRVVPLCRMLDHVGVLCRSVDDAAKVFNILCNKNPGETQQSLETIEQIPNDAINIGIVEDTTALRLQPEVAAAYNIACEKLRANDYSLTAINAADWQLPAVRRAGLMLIEAELLNTLEDIYPSSGDRLPKQLLSMLAFIEKKSAKDVGRAIAILTQAKIRYLNSFNGFDAVVLPTCPHTAFAMNAKVPDDSADLTSIANVLSAPSITLPLPVGDGELPAAIQLICANGQDNRLLTLASSVEALILN